jgi:hypothetical protein
MLNIFANNTATKTAKMHFKKSHKKVITAGSLPAVRRTFVAPALPLPCFLMSVPVAIFVIITDELMLPNRYAQTAANINGRINDIYTLHAGLARN